MLILLILILYIHWLISAADICPVSAAGIFLVSTEAICPAETSLLLQEPIAREQTSVLSQHTMLMSQNFQLWQCRSVQVADRRYGFLNNQKWVEWVQNGCQDLRIDPLACRGYSQASGTNPAAKKSAEQVKQWHVLGLALGSLMLFFSFIFWSIVMAPTLQSDGLSMVVAKVVPTHYYTTGE